MHVVAEKPASTLPKQLILVKYLLFIDIAAIAVSWVLTIYSLIFMHWYISCCVLSRLLSRFHGTLFIYIQIACSSFELMMHRLST